MADDKKLMVRCLSNPISYPYGVKADGSKGNDFAKGELFEIPQTIKVNGKEVETLKHLKQLLGERNVDVNDGIASKKAVEEQKAKIAELEKQTTEKDDTIAELEKQIAELKGKKK